MNISFDEVKEIWEKNIRPTVLYLNNPFCKGGKEHTNCKYCVHRGCVKHKSDNIVDKFYFEEMPKRIKKYLPVIIKQNIKLISFGGGTPNYLSIEKIKKYLNIISKLIPNFIYTNKIIELHPAYINEELIYTLKDYNFTSLIFCFQTFDEKILAEQNRASCNFDEIKKCIKLSKDLGMKNGCDLITMWDRDISKWSCVLKKDLEKIKELDLDEITISPLYQVKYSKDIDLTKSYSTIKMLTDNLLDNYSNLEFSLYLKDFAAIRFFKDGKKIKDWEIYKNSLTDFSWNNEQGYSTLGIGDYGSKDKNVYSIIGPNYTICEKNINDNFDVEYELIKKYNFWESAKNVINALEEYYKGIEIPVGTELTLKNICERANDDCAYIKFKQGNCEWQLEDNCIPEETDIGKKIKENFNNKLNLLDRKKIRDFNNID